MNLSFKKTSKTGDVKIAPNETSKVFFFEVEASNENVDANRQIVLKSALRESAGYFLSNGAISVDHRLWKHLPDNQIAIDQRYIIGTPIEVYFQGKSTWVKGKLYKDNPLAQIAIKLLRQGSKRLYASIGGFSPGINISPDGIQRVTSLKWNDLSLTLTPVNNTLQPAQAIKKKPSKLVLRTKKNKEAQYE